MIFREFLAWAQTAPAASRAEGAGIVARAFLESDIAAEDRADAETAMTALLDDPAASVRRALAVELAGSVRAPRHIISALAADLSEVSVPVLSRSPLLGDGELTDCVAMGDVYAQAAIALRPGLSEAVAFAIADKGEREAVISLAVNFSAAATETVLRRALARFGADGEVRESILARVDLSPAIRAELVSATAAALADFVKGCGWMSADRAERTCREASDSGLIEVAADTARGGHAAAGLVRHLRQDGVLTPSLLLRALLSGNRGLFETAISELASLGADKVGGLVSAWSGAGFAAIYGRAGLPATLLPVFRAALSAQDEYGLIYAPGQRPQLSLLLIDRTIRALDAINGPDLARVMAMLQRLRAEAARTQARVLTRDYIQAAQAPAVLAPGPRIIEIDLDAIAAELEQAA